MKTKLVQSLTTNFEAYTQQTDTGIAFWLARDIQRLLGYRKWDNFLNVVSKAKTACDVSGHAVTDHFADVGKIVDLGSGSQREVDDLMFTRYACYLIAQNGDPKKQEIAFAQTYFAIQTRKVELIEQRLLDAERIQLALSLPNPITGLPQANTQFNLHVSCAFVGHGVVHLVQPGQQAQAKVARVAAGLDPCLMFVKALVNVQPGHTDVHKRLAQDVVRVTAPKACDVPHLGRQLDDVDAVVMSALLLGGLFRHDYKLRECYLINSCSRIYPLVWRPKTCPKMA